MTPASDARMGWKVFVSSVRRGLEEERDTVEAMLRALAHEPILFEGWAAQGSASRSACLAAVASSDVYLLLLGGSYGQPMPDTGLSPTEEEYNTARTHGIPVLVFKKSVPDVEHLQTEFIRRVGDYTDGRFWKAFDTASQLGPAVVAALSQVDLTPAEVEWRPLDGPLPVGWIRPTGPGHHSSATGPVVELHVLPVVQVAIRPAVGAARLAQTAIAAMRSSGFIDVSEPVDDQSSDDVIDLRRPSQPEHTRSGMTVVTRDRYRGVRIHPLGAIGGFQVLPTDSLGSVTDRKDMARLLRELLDALLPLLPPDADAFAIAAGLFDDGKVSLGSPRELGRASGAWNASAEPIVIEADRSVTRDGLLGSTGIIAEEIAERIVRRLETRHLGRLR